jgi:nitrite reductase/ring-hydroxylating ferredoxin subunit
MVDRRRGEVMDEFTVVLEEGELQAGAMRTVDVGGIRVLLSRSEDGGECAIDNASTHRGGPLDERDGNAIACPLTRFPVRPVLREGAAGSGREPQRRFESRLRAGKIEVRSPK